MTTKLSTKGQVVLPAALRRKLGLVAGDALEAKAVRGTIVLVPRRRRATKPRIVVDAATGIPAISLGKHAPPLTSRQVAAILADFP